MGRKGRKQKRTGSASRDASGDASQQQSGVSQQRPVASQQQPGGPQQRPAAPEQQRPGVPQQQQQPAYGPRQQQPGITPQHSVTPQQQSGVSQQRPVASQQQPGGPQQRPVTPQQQPISSKQLETPSKAFPPMDVVASSVLQTAKSQRSASLMQSYIDQIPKRKAPGTLGIPIQVETNMFRLIFDKNFETDVVHYDVDINPDRPKFLLRPVFEAFRKKNCPHRYPAYDGRKNAYSAKELPFGDQKEDEVEVFDKEREQTRRFAIKLTKAAVLDLSWFKKITPKTEVVQNAVQALDIILRHGPASQWITVGRSLFREEPGKVVSLSGGLDLWVGVFQSAIVGWRPYLNVDVAHKGFPTSQGVIDLMKELCQPPQRGRDPPQQPRDITAQDVHRNKEKINKYLKGLKIQYVTPGQSKRTQRVNGLGDSPRTLTFTLQNGSKCTVEQYFAQEKKYKIRFPDLPCIWIGSREKKIYVPPELCTIVAGQVVQRKMDEQQTSRMIKIAATDTTTRKEKILRGFESMKLNENPVMKNEFKLSVQGQFERVPARVLEPPKLFYDRVTNVSKGVWRAGKFKTAMDLEEGSWTILNLNGRYTYDRDLYVLHDRLQGGGGPLNMSIGKAQVPFTSISLQDGPSGHKIRNYFEEKKSQKLKLVIVVIPDFADAYSTVKQVTELHVGVLTQCIKAQTLRKLSDATVGNILLKINSKLNGINHVFEPTHRPRCLNTPCIIIGADVTHPSPDATDIPSIAAVAASHDPNAFQYNIEIRLQPPREEMIQDLEEIMRLQLIYFFKKTGHKPAKVIFYRDGVSEGQLPQVMHYELSAIKRAFQKLQANYNPLVTFIVVQKRHHIRLFPTNKRFSDDRNFNVQAGTIVDTDITHPSHIDFYLVSHASIQGTARPTKYRCISNENEQSEDEIEQLTYYLCHMFARCTRSVSYPAPTYYAHLAAFRARALTHNVPIDLGNLKEEQRRKMTLQVNAQAPMFFV